MDDYLRPRWDGTPGRLEVWYTTLTDPVSGAGVWLHHELIAPSDGGEAFAHGWAAVFPVDGPVVSGRFGDGPFAGGDGFRAGDVLVAGERLAGSAEGLSWDLGVRGGGRPMFTFPEWAWRREVLPTAHMVVAPGARFDGEVRWADSVLRIADGIGATARVYGHGNAVRWVWLHADLGGGDVLEVVGGVSGRPVLRWLPPLTFVRLRVGGEDWIPGLLPVMRTRIGWPRWSVWGSGRGIRVRVDVELVEGRVLAVPYREPDGRTAAVCRNSERANAVVRVERKERGGWWRLRRWDVDGAAHAEVGGNGQT